jgi:hypothetical protein
MKFTPTTLRITVFVFALCWWCTASGKSSEKVTITTWNLEWFPNGSPKELSFDAQHVRITAAAGVLRQLDPAAPRREQVVAVSGTDVAAVN